MPTPPNTANPTPTPTQMPTCMGSNRTYVQCISYRRTAVEQDQVLRGDERDEDEGGAVEGSLGVLEGSIETSAVFD